MSMDLERYQALHAEPEPPAEPRYLRVLDVMAGVAFGLLLFAGALQIAAWLV